MADNDVPGHDQNGSRGFLADEIRAQRAEITTLGKEVASLQSWLAQLIEAEKRARESRDRLYQQIEALRAEVAQIMQPVAGMQTEVKQLTTSVTALSKIVGEMDDERQQVKGAANLAKSISGAGWGIVGMIAGSALVITGWVMRWFPQGSPPPTPGGHP